MDITIDEDELKNDIHGLTREVLKEVICNKLENLDILDDLIIASARNSIDEMMEDEDVKNKLKEKLIEDLDSEYYFEHVDVINLIRSNILHIMKYKLGLIEIVNK